MKVTESYEEFRAEFATRQAARIMMEGDQEYIKVSWDSFLDQDETEQKSQHLKKTRESALRGKYTPGWCSYLTF